MFRCYRFSLHSSYNFGQLLYLKDSLCVKKKYILLFNTFQTLDQFHPVWISFKSQSSGYKHFFFFNEIQDSLNFSAFISDLNCSVQFRCAFILSAGKHKFPLSSSSKAYLSDDHQFWKTIKHSSFARCLLTGYIK